MFDTDEEEDTTVYLVVLNDEEQYSIWPADRELPAGWRSEGTSGLKDVCLTHIDRVWTDMRPASLRRFMEQAERDRAAGVAPEVEEWQDDQPPLVERLSAGDHPVEISLRPERTGPALRDAITAGYVFIRFTDTRGGTELGVQLEPGLCSLDGADFDASTGSIELAGDLVLDFVPVRCTARIDLATMEGQGRLAITDAGTS
ncbi:MbtH family NRPS accessory protein [Modestobacter sp. I12A-02628]|uniref:MbtH family NRPS accessory protein n=1 Tax=Goekera deserti TaxID=2497753 RepID=A0A7K3WF79_9ACTN|nr:MbtH family NRPS accessory protein [Goekera deserti]MPQ96916.1 MbtH family NRPS accessory protein [Goekera deserti]NDI46771.1 MbtH family NRPS accessory protein [Goekera deserti]NEL54340.1 MbtH family NRPS accessory protein [Goekera deserti]